MTETVGSTIPSPASKLPKAKYLQHTEGTGIWVKRGFIPHTFLQPLEEDDWRICVLTARCQGYPEQTLFLYDSRLWREEKLTHKAYRHGLYSLLRGILYTLAGYGVSAPAQGGEFGRLTQDEKAILHCADLLLYGNLLRDGKNEAAVLAAIAAIQNSLVGATDHAKQKAHANAGRGMQLTDSLHRRNVSAATLTLGGMSHQLQKRVRRIVQNAQVYRQHARKVSTRIDQHLVVMLRLRGVLQSKANPNQWGFLQGTDLNTLGENRLAVNQRLIQELRAMFTSITPLAPFHKYWGEILADLAEAEEAAMRDDRQELTRFRTRLRQRAEWILLRHAMEINVNARLGILLRRLERDMQDNLRREFPKVNIGVHDLRFRHEQDPKAFEEVIIAFRFLQEDMARASDRGFSRKFQGSVLDRLTRVDVHMRREEWRTAREELKKALALI